MVLNYDKILDTNTYNVWDFTNQQSEMTFKEQIKIGLGIAISGFILTGFAYAGTRLGIRF